MLLVVQYIWAKWMRDMKVGAKSLIVAKFKKQGAKLKWPIKNEKELKSKSQ